MRSTRLVYSTTRKNSLMQMQPIIIIIDLHPHLEDTFPQKKKNSCKDKAFGFKITSAGGREIVQNI